MAVDSAFPRMGGIIAIFVAVPVLGLWLTCGSSEVDERIAATPGGALTVDLTLGAGLSFDKGSLHVAGHDENEVVVVAETTGWGGYAVDIEVEQTDAGVNVTGEVSGFLHWLFGGPTVDLRILVPPSYSVDASIAGGPLVVEDVIGTVALSGGTGGDWSIQAVDLELRRLKGNVSVVSAEGSVEVEDVDGSLEVETESGRVEVSDMNGRLTVRSEQGRIDIDSVSGAVSLATAGDARVQVDGVAGNLRIATEDGFIEVEDVKGNLEIETLHGRIEVDDLRGQIAARSQSGPIEVEFLTTPTGWIELEHGAITVRVPRDAEFDLQADAGHGPVLLDNHLALVPYDGLPAVSAGATVAAGVADLAELGQEIAAAVASQVQQSVREMQRTDGTNWEWDWNHNFDWNSNWEPSGDGPWRWQGSWDFRQQPGDDDSADDSAKLEVYTGTEADTEADASETDSAQESAENTAENRAEDRRENRAESWVDAHSAARERRQARSAERAERRAEHRAERAERRRGVEPGIALARIGSLIGSLHGGSNRVEGRINGGGPTLRLSTRGGQITVEER